MQFYNPAPEAGWTRGGDVTVVLEGHPITLALFRFHQNHAVGTAGAVDGRRSRVLEDGNGFDVVGIDEIERIAGKRGRTTDADSLRFGREVLDRDPVDHV